MENDKSSWRKAWHLSSHMPQKNLESPLAHTCIQRWNTEKSGRSKRSVNKYDAGDGSGHVPRMAPNRNPHVARLTWAPSGKRKRGRPRKTWTRTVEWERPELGLTGWCAPGLTLWTAAAAVAKNRDKRRTFMSGPTPPRRKELSLGQSLQSHLPFVFLNWKSFLAKTILSSTFLVNGAIVLQI